MQRTLVITNLLLAIAAGCVCLALDLDGAAVGLARSQHGRAANGAAPRFPASSTAETLRLASHVPEVLAEISSIKPAVIDYYLTHGRLPRAGDLAMSGDRVRLLDNGSLEADLGGEPSLRIYWRMAPAASGMPDWDCVTRDSPYIATMLPACRHDPGVRKEQPITEDSRSPAKVNFRFAHSTGKGLADGSEARLERLLTSLSGKPGLEVLAVRLSGYSDPIGKQDFNTRLAMARAGFVRDSFVRAGVDSSRITIISTDIDHARAETCPASLRRAARIACFQESRRVDIEVITRRQL